MRTRRIAIAVETWFRANQRPLPWRSTYDPYQVWISEVMLQQTRMEVVLRYYTRFLGRFPTIASLAAAPLDEVLAAWSGLGYYRRARMLHAAAGRVMERFEGELPRQVPELMTIPGIGRYTAGAIASIAFGRRAPIVDGNIARILARLEGFGDPPGPALMRRSWPAEETLVAASGSPRDFNQGLMELGALVCRPAAPRCDECPLRRSCVAHRTGRVADLPARTARKESRSLVIPLYLIEDRRGRILMRRESGALMTSMFHLPHGATDLFDTPPVEIEPGRHLGSFRHTITDRRIEFHVYRAGATARAIADRRGEYAWIDPSGLEALPHPSYVDKALKFIGA
ncbi:MAG TPA: A/G-specific adenine glycosylase [Thermoanaerobaculia bacterium]|nr:A/G-specific adenine glycosylase [Thermoanaerobaculia bacterium]